MRKRYPCGPDGIYLLNFIVMPTWLVSDHSRIVLIRATRPGSDHFVQFSHFIIEGNGDSGM